jgi:hypothetical protein
MSKERIKGIAIGFIICSMLSASIMVAANSTVTRQITYGIGVMLNGERVQFDEDSKPFVMNGRTFLPLRTLAELLDIPVNFDSATNTAILGRVETRKGTPVSELFFDSSATNVSWGSSKVELRDEAVIGGNRFKNIIAFDATGGWGFSGAGPQKVTQNAMMNLNSKFNWLDICIGRIDGTDARIDASISIYADNRLIESFEQNAQSLPKELRLYVEGIRLIRVEVITTVSDSRNIAYALSGFAE